MNRYLLQLFDAGSHTVTASDMHGIFYEVAR